MFGDSRELEASTAEYSRVDLRITAVIPTRNRPVTLNRALLSAVSQTYRPNHVVVVDEASEPPVHLPAALDGVPVEVIRNIEPAGPAAARNMGAEAATTEWVAFLDDDDWWLPDKLRACVVALGIYPDARAVFHGITATDAVLEGDSAAGGGLVSDPIGRMLGHQPPHPSALLVHRGLHESVRFDESYPAAADLDYSLRLALQAPIVELEDVLARFGAGAAHPSEVALARRLAGRRLFRERHAALFTRPEYDAYHLVRMGHLYRRMGRRGKALDCFARALRLVPHHALAWRGLAMSLVPGPVLRRIVVG